MNRDSMKALVRVQDNHRVYIPEVSHVTQVRGKRNGQVWKEAAILSPFINFFNYYSANPETQVMLAYDQSHLFIGMKVNYDSEAEAIPACECIEVILSPDQSLSQYYRHRIMFPGSSKDVQTDVGLSCIELDQIDSNITKCNGNWFIELAVPFQSLNIKHIQPGDVWRMNILRHAIGNRPANSWVPIRHSYFIDKVNSYFLKAVIAEEGRMGTIIFGDDTSSSRLRICEMAYAGFTEKEVTLHAKGVDVLKSVIQLEWKTPAGKAHRIGHFTITGGEGTYSITFNHPEPLENGLYQLDVTMVVNQGEEAISSSICFDRMDLMEAGYGALQSELLPACTDETPNIMGQPMAIVESAPASEEVRRLIELIPDKTGITFAGLPDRPELWPYMLYDWQPENPAFITSEKSSIIYPNQHYPENREFLVTNPEGEWVRYPYFENENGQKFFLSAHVWSKRRDYVLEQTGRLAAADPLGAARLLYRFAKLYKGYVPVYDYPWLFYPLEKEAGPPYPYWGGLWNRWFYMDLYQLRHLFSAYGQVNRTNAFELLSSETGEDVRSLVVDQMFLPSVSFIKTYPIMNTNMDFANWIGLAALGNALNDPRYIHEIVENMKIFCMNQFLFDGFWKEVTLSYHRQIMVGLKKVTDAIAGWNDPEGYISPRTGGIIEGLDMEKDLPFLKKAQRLLDDLAYPNGSAFPIMDTWAYDTTDDPNLHTGSFLLPAAGIVKMTRGTDRNQMQVYLSFVPKYGHNHLDPLNFVLFAHGQELLPDLGYTHTKYRHSLVSTIGHNTVVVNSKDMDLEQGRHGGNIKVFAPVTPSLQIVRAGQENAYPGVELYDRELWTIGFSDEDAGEGYVLDIFRIHGGNRHEYTLHGDANHESSFYTGLPLLTFGPTLLPEGVEYTEPVLETDQGFAGEHYAPYMYVKQVKKAVIEDGNYELTQVTKDGSANRAQLRIIGNAGNDLCELFIGQSPSLKGTRLYKQDTNDMAELHFAPQMIIRRDGEQLQSAFVTMMEPVGAGRESIIQGMEVNRFPGTHNGDVAVIVKHGKIKDIILSTVMPDGGQIIFGDICMQGKMGFIRMEGEEVKQMMLLGGSLLKTGNLILRGTGTLRGTVCTVLRRMGGHTCNAFIVNVPVPMHLTGSHIIVTHPDGKTHGYMIQDIRTEQRGTVLDLADMDPGFTIQDDGTSEMNYFPHTKWSGEHSFYIDSIVLHEK